MICKYTQHHTYKARCLPQEIDISEVLRLPQKMTVILRKSFKYFAGHTKGFSTHVINTWECCQVPHPPHKTTSMSLNSYLAKIVQKCACHTKRFSTRYLTRRNVTKRNACDKTTCHVLQNLQKSQLSQVRDRHDHIFPIADSRRRLPTASNVERTHLHPKSPKDKREPFALHSGIIYIYTHKLGPSPLSKCQKYD